MEPSLIIVTGNPRAGKTSLVVANTIMTEMNYYSERYYNCVQYIKARNKRLGQNKSLPPQRHVVFSNFDISRKYPNLQNYPISGFEFGVPNQYCPEVKPLVPYGYYVFDEAHKYFGNLGDSKELPPWVRQAFDWRGHIFLKIILITQHYMNINARIRRVCDLFIHVNESTHTFDIGNRRIKTHEFIEGNLLKTDWDYCCFKREEELDQYLRGLNPVEEEHYTFQGDIRDHYDPNGYATEMEDLSKDFAYFDYSSVDEVPKGWSDYKKKVKNG